MSSYNFVEVENVLNKFKKINDAVKNGMVSTKEIALDCEENEEGSLEVDSLKGIMLAYANITRDMSQWDISIRKTVSDFRKNNAEEPDKVDIEDIFNKTLADLQVNNHQSDLEENPSVKEFIQQIWEVNHSGINPDAVDDEMSKDQDIVISQILGDKLLCPITKTEMEEPMKNRLCGHSYGKKAVEEHIKRMKHKAKCPVAGCMHFVRMDDLEVDKVLLRELKKRHK